MPAKKSAPKTTQSFEESLWQTTSELLGSLEYYQCKHIVLSLIFLKFVSDKFEERREQLITEGHEEYADMVEFYTMKNIFYLPETSRWSYIQQHAKQGDIAIKIDSALTAVEASNASLKSALPDNYFSSLGLDGSKLSALIDAISELSTIESHIGQLYGDLLGKFACSIQRAVDESHTPECIVTLIVSMMNPSKGKIYDPCCGSGGMLVQAIKFNQDKSDNCQELTAYGQEFNRSAYQLAKMYLAVNGLSADLGEGPANTFFADKHPDLKADYIMAAPPFSLRNWRAANELVHDSRWGSYDTPPPSNANYAWILHTVSKLSDSGVAGLVLTNSSMSTAGVEGAIRQKLVDNDLVECIVALPGQLFYNTAIPVCLWILTKNKKADTERGYRNREGETLFIDARKLGSMISRSNKELNAEDIAKVTATYNAWRSVPSNNEQPSTDNSSAYADVPSYCKSATLDEIRKHDYMLTPGHYMSPATIDDARNLSEYLSFLPQSCSNLDECRLADIALEINAGHRDQQFTEKANAVYISRSPRKKSTSEITDIPADKSLHYYQVVLNDKTINHYVANFLRSKIGQFALAGLGEGMAPFIRRNRLGECPILLPSLEIQKASVETHRKLALLRQSIQQIDQSISLDPTLSPEFDEPLDLMLQSVSSIESAHPLEFEKPQF